MAGKNKTVAAADAAAVVAPAIPAARTTLDRARAYGEIHGLHQAKYEQGGKLFDAFGEEVVEPGSPAPDAPVDAAPAPVVTETQAGNAVLASAVDDEAALAALSQGG